MENRFNPTWASLSQYSTALHDNAKDEFWIHQPDVTIYLVISQITASELILDFFNI